jgi:hypothetical protein
MFRRFYQTACDRLRTDAVGRSNFSTAAEADGHFARFNDDRDLASSLGVF